MSQHTAAAEPQLPHRFRWGWIFAAVWLVFLLDPLQALLSHNGLLARAAGLVALAAFVALYVFTINRGRRWIGTAVMPPVSLCWAWIATLTALVAVMIPGAGQKALTAAVYIAVVGMLNLPVGHAVANAALLAAGCELLIRVVPGWHNNSYSASVVLASVAMFGVRMAVERNRRLIVAQQELSELAVENERARIARDLHDILGHSLTVVAIKAELAQRLLDVDLARARTELKELEALCRDALADVRATARGVRGVSLAGEIAAARAALAAADINADLPTAADEVPSRWRELFAWTIREAATNVVRHSGASSCTVTLTPSSVEILDDGAGPGAAHGDGQGLANVRQRAESLGASLTTGARSDGTGFSVRVDVPA